MVSEQLSAETGRQEGHLGGQCWWGRKKMCCILDLQMGLYRAEKQAGRGRGRPQASERPRGRVCSQEYPIAVNIPQGESGEGFAEGEPQGEAGICRQKGPVARAA